MDYIVVPQLRKVVAWSNKCGGSSIRRQIILDINDPLLLDQLPTKGSWDLIKELFSFNPKVTTVPMDYDFEWYVRDPFFRVLSCFINRKIIIEGGDPDITFKDFIFNLDHFRSLSSNIKSHTEPQIKRYFEAPWKIIDINQAQFSFKQKMNSTRYTLGDKINAWSIPAKDVVVDNQTYSAASFYSQDIVSEIKSFYIDDYAFLRDKIHLI